MTQPMVDRSPGKVPQPKRGTEPEYEARNPNDDGVLETVGEVRRGRVDRQRGILETGTPVDYIIYHN